MPSVLNDVADYIIQRCSAAGLALNVLKLQKLVYYCQAWSLAFGRGKLFDERFQAWVHGPVSRTLYDRFASTKSLYSEVTDADVENPCAEESLGADRRNLVESVLEAYAKFSGTELEQMTHSERPWVEARAGVAPFVRSENEISEETMAAFYGGRLR